MAQLTIENVDPQVLDRLRERAAERGTTLEGELHSILRRAAGMELARLTPEIERVRAMFQDRIHSDSAELLREDRDR